jgi:hypothetical protein
MIFRGLIVGTVLNLFKLDIIFIARVRSPGRVRWPMPSDSGNSCEPPRVLEESTKDEGALKIPIFRLYIRKLISCQENVSVCQGPETLRAKVGGARGSAVPSHYRNRSITALMQLR